MLFNDKKKMASIIVAKLGKSGSHEQKAEESLSDDDAGLQSAAEDMLQALEDKSATDLVAALSAFLDCYQADSTDEADEDDEDWGG